MATKKSNNQKTLIDFFDEFDLKYLNLSAEHKERIKNLPIKKEAKKWPKPIL